MDTIFVNSENSKTSVSHRLLINLSHKINFKISDKYVLYQILAYTIQGKIWKSYIKNNEFKISALTWNERYELADGSYSIPHIQDYF